MCNETTQSSRLKISWTRHASQWTRQICDAEHAHFGPECEGAFIGVACGFKMHPSLPEWIQSMPIIVWVWEFFLG